MALDTRITALAQAIGADIKALQSLVGSTNPQGNLLLNPHLAINQREVSGTIVCAAGAYGHDMWKGGSAGCTYSVSGSGLSAVVTVSAGTLQQVVEGLRLTSGPVCLSWVGTAQARIGGGPWGGSGITATATAGTHLTVEFGPGTFSCPKLERGSAPTLFVQRDFISEQTACRRYLCRHGEKSTAGVDFIAPGLAGSATAGLFYGHFAVPMRAIPTFSIGAGGTVSDFYVYRQGAYTLLTALSLNTVTTRDLWVLSYSTSSGNSTAGLATFLGAATPASKFLLFSAEL